MRKTMYVIVLSVFVFCYSIYLYEKSKFPFNRQLSKSQLTAYSPRVEIKATYFINMDKSIDRRESFIRRFNETNGPKPLIRSPGVLVEDTSIKNPGNYGCSMAHAKCLRTVSNSAEGWYLVCEDDGVGNFGSIPDNVYVRAIVHQTDKVFINLSSQVYFGRLFDTGHSLSKVFARATAYLIHSSYALELSKNVEFYSKTKLVDLVFCDLLKEPRIFDKNCNGKGAFVGIIDPPDEKVVVSDRNSLNNTN